MMRFGIVPMFLFSGTFFPISQLPDWLEPVAIATPLFHAVDLVRKLALPGVGEGVVTTIPMWVHVAYLVVMTAAGWLLASRYLEGRMKKSRRTGRHDRPHRSRPGRPAARSGRIPGPPGAGAQLPGLPPDLESHLQRLLRARLLPLLDRNRSGRPGR